MESLQARYRGRTVAVTGASGYLGAALLEAFRDSGARVIAASRRPVAQRERVEWVEFDLRSPDCWTEVVRHADVIFHLAGNTSTRHAARDPEGSLASTVVPIARLIDAARATGRAPRVVFASTATVYGLTEHLPVAEDVPPRPQTIYDLHKWWAEQYLEMATRQSVLDAVSLRLANVYGLSPAVAAGGRGFLNQCAAQSARGLDLDLYGDGSYLRDFVHLDDVVRAMLIAGARSGSSSPVLNIGSGTGTPLADALAAVVTRASRLAGRGVSVRQVAWPPDSDPIDRRSFVADIDRVRAEYGWQPTIALTSGIDQLVTAMAGREAAPQTTAGPRRLNLGCGGRPLPGYLNIDRDPAAAIRVRYPGRALADELPIAQYDLFNLPFTAESVDEVRADALIEHLGFIEERPFFEEVVRVLRPGGELCLTTVDFEAAAKQWLAAVDDWRDFYRTDDEAIRGEHWFGTYTREPANRWGYATATLFGNQNGAGQFHKNCYTEAKLRAICARLGLLVDRIERVQWQGDRDPMLKLTARKPACRCA